MPKRPQVVQDSIVIVRLHGVDFDELEVWIEAPGYRINGQAGKIPVGIEGMIDLYNQSALAARFREHLINGCGTGIDLQRLAGQQRKGVEVGPGRGELDRRNEG